MKCVVESVTVTLRVKQHEMRSGERNGYPATKSRKAVVEKVPVTLRVKQHQLDYTHECILCVKTRSVVFQYYLRY